MNAMGRDVAMRMLQWGLLLLILPAIAYADAPKIERIDIVEFGIYATDTTSVRSAPGTPTGAVTELTNVRLQKATRTVPARVGVRFGFRYTVVGAPADAGVTIHFRTIFPKPGLLNPKTRQRVAQSDYDANMIIGGTGYKDYGFDEAWEAVPGTWRFQVWHEGRMLTEQKFTVVKE
jgi:hypothetical protein